MLTYFGIFLTLFSLLVGPYLTKLSFFGRVQAVVTSSCVFFIGALTVAYNTATKYISTNPELVIAIWIAMMLMITIFCLVSLVKDDDNA